MIRPPPSSTRPDPPFPYTTLFRSVRRPAGVGARRVPGRERPGLAASGPARSLEPEHRRGNARGGDAASRLGGMRSTPLDLQREIIRCGLWSVWASGLSGLMAKRHAGEGGILSFHRILGPESRTFEIGRAHV